MNPSTTDTDVNDEDTEIQEHGKVSKRASSTTPSPMLEPSVIPFGNSRPQ